VSLYTVRICILIRKQLKLERPANGGDELENVATHASYEQIYVVMFYVMYETSDVICTFFIGASHL
jgi:hypothetical protein